MNSKIFAVKDKFIVATALLFLFYANSDANGEVRSHIFELVERNGASAIDSKHIDDLIEYCPTLLMSVSKALHEIKVRGDVSNNEIGQRANEARLQLELSVLEANESKMTLLETFTRNEQGIKKDMLDYAQDVCAFNIELGRKLIGNAPK